MLGLVAISIRVSIRVSVVMKVSLQCLLPFSLNVSD